MEMVANNYKTNVLKKPVFYGIILPEKT